MQLIAEDEFIAEVARLELLLDPEPTRNLPINGRYIGRFGKKGSAINLLHQAVTAYREDMGITSDLIPEDPVNPQVGGLAHFDLRKLGGDACDRFGNVALGMSC